MDHGPAGVIAALYVPQMGQTQRVRADEFLGFLATLCCSNKRPPLKARTCETVDYSNTPPIIAQAKVSSYSKFISWPQRCDKGLMYCHLKVKEGYGRRLNRVMGLWQRPPGRGRRARSTTSKAGPPVRFLCACRRASWEFGT